jgi:peroxiredoxin
MLHGMISINRSTWVVTFASSLLVSGIGRAELADSPEKVTPLHEGQTVPAVTLTTVDGKAFALQAETAKQPTVIIFYRGGWCPYCNRHLSDVQKVEKELLALGYRILAISPDMIEALRAAAEKDQLTYTLLSDADMKATDAFGLAFRLDDATVEKYKGYGIKLTAQHDGHYWLPVPAVYLVGKDGRIAYAHWNPNYKVRLSGAELLQAAREASAK